ncbi:MAG: fibronectin type III domain-containing protein, partial [Planctomycetaceae bacterium]|nr:fibronectin type III domain-containing protein [Planctomycetaceae bacterium]
MIKNILKIVHTFLGSAATSNTEKIKKRKLQIENLEVRDLLSVSVADFDWLRSTYSDINFESSLSHYNVIEITTSQLNETNLKNAITTAGTTTQDDLIVLRGGKESVIDLGSSFLNIDIDSSIYGSVGIFSLGEGLLQISSTNNSSIVNISKGEVSIGGVAVLGVETAGVSFSVFDVIQTSSYANLTTDNIIEAVSTNHNVGNYSLTGSPEPTAGSAIGSRKSIKANIQLEGTQFAFIAGLSQDEYNQFMGGSNDLSIVQPYDAEKYYVDGTDLNLCWAASASNMLAYTSWGDVNGFQNEDDIFDYFRENFTDRGSNQFLGLEWFFTGDYGTMVVDLEGRPILGNPEWAQPTPGSGGLYDNVTWNNHQLISGENIVSVISSDISNAAALQEVKSKLDSGYAIGLGIDWLDVNIGHAITMWGFVYDTSMTGESYYLSLLVCDSDNYGRLDDPHGAVDTLDRLDMRYDSSLGCYVFTNPPAYSTGKLSDYTWLAQRDSGTTEQVPTTPQNLRSTAQTSSSISLEWNLQNGLTGYTLEYKKSDATEWTVWTPAPVAAAATAIVTGLDADTNYDFRLTATNNIGSSEPATTNAKTLAEVVSEDDDYEDNDSFDIVDAAALDSENDHTPKLGVIEAAKVISGLKLVDGNDYFKFEITQNGTVDSYVQITFENSVGDIDFQLFNGNRNFVRSSSTTENIEKISLNGLVAGEYYVRIFAYRESTNLNYTLTIVPPTNSQNNTPSTPENLNAEQTGGSQVTLTWGTVTDADSYKVYKKDGDVFTLLATVAGTTYVINDLAEEGEYTYAVSAVSENSGESGKAEANVTVASSTPDMLVAPANVVATYENGVITVTWDEVANATKYQIYILTNSEWTQIADSVTGNSTSIDATEYTPGVYSIAVTASNENNQQSDKAETTVEITTNENENEDTNPTEDKYENNNTIESAYNLGAITSVKTLENLALLDDADYYRFELTAKGDTKSYVRIAFDVSLGDVELQIYNASKKAIKSASSTGNSEQISLNGLVAGIYYIRVYGYKKATNPSYTLTINPPAASVTTPQPPATPTGLTATENENTVTLKWNSVTDAASYNVYRQEGQNWTLFSSVSGTSFTLNDLADGTYNFAVSAVSNNGESEKTSISITL